MYKILLFSLLCFLPLTQAQAADTNDVNTFLNKIKQDSDVQARIPASKMHDSYSSTSSNTSSSGNGVSSSVASSIQQSADSMGSRAASTMYDSSLQ